MIDMHRGAAMALDAAVKMLRQVAIQAEDKGSRENAAILHAAATLVRGLDPITVVAKAMETQSAMTEGHGPKDDSAARQGLPEPQSDTPS